MKAGDMGYNLAGPSMAATPFAGSPPSQASLGDCWCPGARLRDQVPSCPDGLRGPWFSAPSASQIRKSEDQFEASPSQARHGRTSATANAACPADKFLDRDDGE